MNVNKAAYCENIKYNDVTKHTHTQVGVSVFVTAFHWRAPAPKPEL